MTRFFSFPETSLRIKLLASFFAIVLVVITSTLYFVKFAVFSHSEKLLMQNTKVSSALITEHLNDAARVLFKSANTLSGDFSTKQLVLDSANDVKSLDLAMENFTTRFSATHYGVIGQQGELISATRGFDISTINNPNRFANDAITWHVNNNDVFLTKSVAIKNTPRSRNVMAWLVFAIPAEALFNDEMMQLTQLDVSLIKNNKDIIRSSYDIEIVEQIVNSPLTNAIGIQNFDLDTGHYLYTLESVGEAVNADISLMLSTAEEDAYFSYNNLITQLIGLLVFISIFVLVLAIYLARNISLPIDNLIHITDKIGKGLDVHDFPSSDTKEVNTLSHAVSNMHEGMLARQEQINRLAFYDNLTELPNRVRFIQYLDEQLKSNKHTSIFLALVDISRFKEVNDAIGHEAGDELLKLVSKRLNSRYKNDMFVARMGSNEFALLNFDFDSLSEFMADIQQSFKHVFCVNNVSLNIDINIGATSFYYDTDKNNGSANLLLQADIALQACKNKHSACLEYSSELNTFSVERLQTLSELKDIVSSNQLSLYFQPKLCLASKEITNVECLARWIHPDRGFIPPDDFIPLAEQSGAIRQITQWAIETAICQHRDWYKQGMDLKMAVNISAIDLADPDFAKIVVGLLTKHHVEPHKLILEVTESAVMSDTEVALQTLNLLSKIGIGISIDDFGTGFSSMAQLKKLPVNELKIDKAFVLEMATSVDDQAMVKTLISLANNLGLHTVAEGVEDLAALNLLEEMGCTYAQGYFISRPMPPSDASKWLLQKTRDVTKACHEA
ncbi:EAL domain-containing protein [Glaciecola petra]|uniref:EAL domain-containing protein n=1 Tax=Glaciecola petra TaxID=3075602 RepID=A0ABU2ZTR8_9ALTE|nr:EAL domain-containing protein [Aestuariibacter sp. P117]MDT0596027.1 EAL domain-containing protein [Aestuariibacter sp. P117]